MKWGKLKLEEGKKYMANKVRVKYNSFTFPSGVKFCLTMEAKVITFLGMDANVHGKNIKDICIINGKGKRT